MNKIELPTKRELKGQRFGQFSWNAMAKASGWGEPVGGNLFYIENKELEKLLNEYLEDA